MHACYANGDVKLLTIIDLKQFAWSLLLMATKLYQVQFKNMLCKWWFKASNNYWFEAIRMKFTTDGNQTLSSAIQK